MACTLEVVRNNGTLSVRLVLPPDFVGFQGHFPGDPILPGVCMVEAVLAVVEAAHGTTLALKSIGSAKFRAPVRPGQPILIDCTTTSSDEAGLTLRARISSPDGAGMARAESRIADLVLLVTTS